MIVKMNTLVFLIIFLSLNQNVFTQENGKIENSDKSQAKLITSSPYANSEVESANIDVLRNVVNNNPKSKGVIVLYCGKTCQYGEIEAHIRGINMSLGGKRWKEKDFLILNGGFKEEFIIEYWLVPENACFPTPDPTVNIKDVKFKGTYKSKSVPYDCCGLIR